MNANVLVMDKLGPNLEQLRRFCRKQFGLKTVLMLGEQMVRGWNSYVADTQHSCHFAFDGRSSRRWNRCMGGG
jgi:hypothetical protein